jgi:hypothetical protein
MNDLRRPDRDETPLSDAEVLIGVREGTIPTGPHARARAFCDVLVLERRRVEVFNFEEQAA